MANPESLIRRFQRAAQQRLTSAELLWHHGMNLEAMYIAGYVVECAIKAVLLSNVPAKERQTFMAEHFRGASGHDLEFLQGMLRQRGVNLPNDVLRALRLLNEWSTDLRYEVARRTPKQAKAYLEAAKTVYDWMNRSL